MDSGVQEYIKLEPIHSPYSMTGGTVSPNPFFQGSTSPQPGPSFQTYRPQQASPGRLSPMPMKYNIPLDQYRPNLQNHYEFPPIVQGVPQPPMDNLVQDVYLNTPPLQPYQQIGVNNNIFGGVGEVVYQEPNELTLRNEGSNNLSMLDLDNQQFLGSEMQFRTSDILNAVLDDNKLSQELNVGLQISDPTPEPEQPSGMTDSLTRLTRNIQSLNEMYRPNNQN